MLLKIFPENGELLCMGSNAFGQLGLPGISHATSPVSYVKCIILLLVIYKVKKTKFCSDYK